MVKSGGLGRSAHRTAHALARLFLTLAMIIAVPVPAHADDTDGESRAAPVLWVEAELQPDILHVQAQARYTLRLYQAVSARELTFHGPESALAEIRPSDENIREVTHKDRRYRVTERHYAVIPFASGTLQLTGGHVSLRTDGASLPERRMDAPPLAREVRAVPAGHRPDEWLPARAVTLVESWQPDSAQARPGQALRRTIRIEARGVAAAQIPPLHPGADGFSVHPEPPQLEERDEDGWVTGIREQTWRLVPRQGGNLTLPVVQLPWWDTVAGRPRQTTLPARSITVPTAPGTPDMMAAAAAAAVAPAAAPQSAPAIPAADANANTPATALALLAALALLTAVATFARRYRDDATLRRIRETCRNNDPVEARAVLLQWSREIGVPGPAGLLALARHLGGAATRRELTTLDRLLYGKEGQPWNGQDLIEALRREQPGFRPWHPRRRKSPRRSPSTPNLAHDNPNDSVPPVSRPGVHTRKRRAGSPPRGPVAVRRPRK